MEEVTSGILFETSFVCDDNSREKIRSQLDRHKKFQEATSLFKVVKKLSTPSTNNNIYQCVLQDLLRLPHHDP